MPILILLGQLVLVAHYMPFGDRWFLTVDDADAFRYGKAVADRGLPTIPTSSVVPPGLDPSKGFIPIGSFETKTGELTTIRPPLFFYLVAPAAAEGPMAVFVVTELLAVMSLVAIFALLRRLAGGWAASLGLALVSFHPSVLFWSWAPRSNVVGVGMLAVCILLFLAPGRGPKALGALLLPLLPLFRFELIIPAALLGVWQLGKTFQEHERRLRRTAMLGMAALVGLGITAFFGLHVYGNADLIAVLTGRIGPSDDGGGVAEAVTGSLSESRLQVLERNYDAFEFLLFTPLAALVGAVSVNAKRNLALPVAVGTVAATAYIFSSEYSVQPTLMLQSQTRYLIPVVLAAAMVLVVSLRRAPKAVTVVMTLAVVASTSAGIAFLTENSGFEETRTIAAYGTELADRAGSLPEGSVFIGYALAYALPERFAFVPHVWPDLNEQESQLVNTTHTLLSKGIHVYGEYRYGAHYAEWIRKSSTMMVVDEGLLWSAHLSNATR